MSWNGKKAPQAPFRRNRRHRKFSPYPPKNLALHLSLCVLLALGVITWIRIDNLSSSWLQDIVSGLFATLLVAAGIYGRVGLKYEMGYDGWGTGFLPITVGAVAGILALMKLEDMNLLGAVIIASGIAFLLYMIFYSYMVIRELRGKVGLGIIILATFLVILQIVRVIRMN